MDYFDFKKSQDRISRVFSIYGFILFFTYIGIALLVVLNLVVPVITIAYLFFGTGILSLAFIFMSVLVSSRSFNKMSIYLLYVWISLAIIYVIFLWWTETPLLGQKITDDKMLVFASIAYVSATIYIIKSSQKSFEYGRLPQIICYFFPTKVLFKNFGEFPAENFHATLEVIYPFPTNFLSVIKTWFLQGLFNIPLLRRVSEKNFIKHDEPEIIGDGDTSFNFIEHLQKIFKLDSRENERDGSIEYFSKEEIKVGLILYYHYTSDTGFRIPFRLMQMVILKIDKSGSEIESEPEKIKSHY